MNGATRVEAYFATLPADHHAALTALRALLRGLLPDHPEVMSFAMPGFRQPGLNGKMVAGVAAFSRRVGLYPHSGGVIPLLKAECAGFKTSRSGVLFTPECPLPQALVARIVALRQAEIAAG